MTDAAQAPGGGRGTAAGPARPDGQPSPDGARATEPQAVPDAGPVPLLEPRDGPPPLVTSMPELDLAVAALAAGAGPLAVDAVRASGFRYGHRADRPRSLPGPHRP